MGDLSPKEATFLRQREREWTKVRKRKCSQESRDSEGECMWSLVMSCCEAFETVRRRIWLEKLPS